MKKMGDMSFKMQKNAKKLEELEENDWYNTTRFKNYYEVLSIFNRISQTIYIYLWTLARTIVISSKTPSFGYSAPYFWALR